MPTISGDKGMLSFVKMSEVSYADSYQCSIVLLTVLIQWFNIVSSETRIRSEGEEEDCPPCKAKYVRDIKCLLPKNYSNTEIPYENDQPVVVSVHFHITHLASVDPETMTFKMGVYAGMRYRDYRICDNMEVKKTTLLHQSWIPYIWQPESYIRNIVDGKIVSVGSKYTTMYLRPNKIAMIYAQWNLLLTCDMDLTNFPHDVQQCGIDIRTATGYDTEIKLEWHAVSISDTIVLSQYDVLKVEKITSKLVGFTGNFSRLLAVIHLKRRIGFYMIHLYIPSILIVVMSMLSFWMPPEAVPARCALPVTSLLTLATSQGKTSISSVSYVMAIDVWMLGCTAFVFGTLLEYAIVSYSLLLEKDAKNGVDKKPSSALAVLFWKCSTNDPVLKPSTKRPTVSPSSSKDELSTSSNRKHPTTRRFPKAREIDRISSILFPVLFAVQLLAYFCYHMVT